MSTETEHRIIGAIIASIGISLSLFLLAAAYAIVRGS
jgi:hypothetical protein